MKALEIQGQKGLSTILVGESLKNLKTYLPPAKTIMITDTNVWKHYHQEFPECEVLKIGTGEGIKTLDTVRDLYEKLMALEADRSTFLVGVGGGIVCDIAGFVASTYLRGLRFGFVSTTLLSQVDASVGGKNGVNLKGYKNLVGVFNQPEFVICDLKLLRTLPEREVRCGLAEVVKHAAIADTELFAYLEKHVDPIMALETGAMEKLVHRSVVIKSAIVNMDEKEAGERRKLNFGHTFGHAFEKTAGISHGEAVSAGMVMASKISEKMGLLSSGERRKIEALLQKFQLPTFFPVKKESVFDAMKKDKKREGSMIRFVLLNGLGSATVKSLSMAQLENYLGE